MTQKRRWACVLALAALLLAAPAQAQTESKGAEAGLGIAAFLTTIPYAVVKLAWAATGSIGAGIAWCVTGGDSDTAGKILDGAVRGDYVLTPSHLTGKEPVEFIGRSPENKAAHQETENAPGW